MRHVSGAVYHYLANYGLSKNCELKSQQSFSTKVLMATINIKHYEIFYCYRRHNGFENVDNLKKLMFVLFFNDTIVLKASQKFLPGHDYNSNWD